QSTAVDQVSREALQVTAMIRKVVSAMSEQGAATTQVNKSVSGTRQQTTHLARSLEEQSQALKQMKAGVENISKQIALITRDNREHAAVAAAAARSMDQLKAGFQENGKNQSPKAKVTSNGSKQSPPKSRTARRR